MQQHEKFSLRHLELQNTEYIQSEIAGVRKFKFQTQRIAWKTEYIHS